MRQAADETGELQFTNRVRPRRTLLHDNGERRGDGVLTAGTSKPRHLYRYTCIHARPRARVCMVYVTCVNVSVTACRAL